MVEKFMSKDLIVLNVDSNIYDVAKVMKERDIGFIPISKNHKIIGVLTDRDIVTKILANNDDKISGYLSTDLIKISYNQTIEEALKKMKEHKIKRLLVEKNKKLVGILSLSDLINEDSNKLIETLKCIYTIDRNTDYYNVEIDEFEL